MIEFASSILHPEHLEAYAEAYAHAGCPMGGVFGALDGTFRLVMQIALIIIFISFPCVLFCYALLHYLKAFAYVVCIF